MWQLGWLPFWMHRVQISWDVKVLHSSVSGTSYSNMRPLSPCSCLLKYQNTQNESKMIFFWKFPWHVHLFTSRYTKLSNCPAINLLYFSLISLNKKRETRVIVWLSVCLLLLTSEPIDEFSLNLVGICLVNHSVKRQFKYLSNRLESFRM
jgi:hypothetical protein